MSSDNTVFDVEFVADLMSVSKQTVLAWVDSGRLESASSPRMTKAQVSLLEALEKDRL